MAASISWSALISLGHQSRAIIPHGHHNMISAHLLLKGEMHVRQYDLLDKTSGHLLIRKTIDEAQGPGSLSSISPDRDNVHWLVALDKPAYTFDVIITGLNTQSDTDFDIYNIDPEGGEHQIDGSLLAPRLSVKDALVKYD